MNKKNVFLIMLAAALFGLVSCGKDNEPIIKEKVYDRYTDEGVVINGVKWATRNVDEVGTFAATPESYGKFYQWNRKIAWPTEGEITGWDETVPEGESWESANDPSPAGWRVPTLEEIQTLLDDTEKVSSKWVMFNGVEGRVFTDIASGNSIFLPAAGWRQYHNGEKGDKMLGIYWCGTTPYNDPAHFEFYDIWAEWSFCRRGFGMCVRPVAK